MPRAFWHMHLACFDIPVVAAHTWLVLAYLHGRRTLRGALVVGIAFGLAAHLPDLNAAPGAALALVVPDVGAWVLGRAAHGPTWTVCHADPEQADAVLRQILEQIPAPR